MSRLTLRHLKLNRRRTIITMIGIMLAIAMVTTVSGMAVSTQDLLYQDAVNRDGLWHVCYYWISPETAAQISAEPIFANSFSQETEEGVELKLELKQLNRDIFTQAEQIADRYAVPQEQIRYHNNLLISRGILPGGYHESIYRFAAVLIVIVAVAAIFVIANAFTISVSERSRQFGLLKSAGATKRQIRNMVLTEGLWLAAFSIPLGLLLGLGLDWLALSIANYFFGQIRGFNMLGGFRVVLSPLVLLTGVVLALATILLAAWLPARRAARISPVEAIRRNQEIKIRARNLRVSRLTDRLFGFEGTLAAKSLKRSRSKYRVTVISLVVSIVLFLGVASFGQQLNTSLGMVYQDYGCNVLVSLYGQGDVERQNRVYESLKQLDGATLSSSREISAMATLPAEMLTQEAEQSFGAAPYNAVLFSLDADSYAALCRATGADMARLEDVQNPAAILINNTGTFIQDGRRTNFTPYRFSGPITVALESEEGEAQSIEIIAQTTEIPPTLTGTIWSTGLNLIISEPVRAALQPDTFDPYLRVYAQADDAALFAAQAEELIAPQMPHNSFSVNDFEANAQNSRNISMLMGILVYGFIGLLSLVGVTSVIATISTNIALRRREFAMLRSVGMTEQGLNKMLNFESLLYGLKALLIGLPLGLAAAYLMYLALEGSFSYPFIWPISSMLICVAAVMLLTFATMAFARSRQKHENIVSNLRDEVI